jgi:hypothetical protein
MSLAVGLSGLIPGTHELIADLVGRLAAGEGFDNRKLSAASDPAIDISAAAAAKGHTTRATLTTRWRRRSIGCSWESEQECS